MMVAANLQELRVIIPWTQLFSQPIQVKLSHVECILTSKSKQGFRSFIGSPPAAAVSQSQPAAPPKRFALPVAALSTRVK
jgi:hypothetical protein